MGENARFKNGHARVNARFKNTSVSKWFLDLFYAMVDSVSARFKNARVEKMPLNIRIQWNAGTACVSECVLKTLACRGLRVGPSKGAPPSDAEEHRQIPRQDSKGKPIGVVRVVIHQMVDVAITFAQQVVHSREDVLREQELAGARCVGVHP